MLQERQKKHKTEKDRKKKDKEMSKKRRLETIEEEESAMAKRTNYGFRDQLDKDGFVDKEKSDDR